MIELGAWPVNLLETLSQAAIADFCAGYGEMFEKRLAHRPEKPTTSDAAGLLRRFTGVVALSQMVCGGTDAVLLLVILDKRALFSLGGVTVMQQLPRIKEQCVNGSLEEALSQADAVGEIGNLIAGSFCRMLRDERCLPAESGEGFAMHLRLPVAVGRMELPNGLEARTFHLFTHRLELPGLEPFAIHVAIPMAQPQGAPLVDNR